MTLNQIKTALLREIQRCEDTYYLAGLLSALTSLLPPHETAEQPPKASTHGHAGARARRSSVADLRPKPKTTTERRPKRRPSSPRRNAP